jgi:hypothetical protein
MAHTLADIPLLTRAQLVALTGQWNLGGARKKMPRREKEFRATARARLAYLMEHPDEEPAVAPPPDAPDDDMPQADADADASLPVDVVVFINSPMDDRRSLTDEFTMLFQFLGLDGLDEPTTTTTLSENSATSIGAESSANKTKAKTGLTCCGSVNYYYSVVQLLTGSVGGSGSSGPIYGELTQASMNKVVEWRSTMFEEEEGRMKRRHRNRRGRD